jgi:hypothetical protein
MARPRAADDFSAIRARMEELRRARDDASADHNDRTPHGPRPYAIGSRPQPGDGTGLLPLMRRAPVIGRISRAS